MSREQLAKDNGMTIEFVNWFFEHKKGGCGNVWFMMMAAMWEGYQAGSASMQAERDQLAAECAALKHAMSVTMEHVSVMDAGQAGVAAMIINDALHNIKTPATDDFLREQMAKGVEMAMDSMQESGCMTFGECYSKLAVFAAQLRNEVKV